MDPNEFRRWIQYGFGRAILYAREHDLSEFRDIILDACLHCYSYDAQIEGTRADYMLELVSLTAEKAFYVDEVLKALPGSGDDYNAVQRFRFAACLAFDGDERAKQVMYESYNPGPKFGEDIGIKFVQMDGIKGLLFAAEKMGELLLSGQQGVDLGWLPSESGEDLGEQKTWDALREAGRTNEKIEKYWRAVEAVEARSGHNQDEFNKFLSASYEELRLKLATLPRSSWIWVARWGEQASDAEIEKAARGLIAARDRKDQHAHLRFFGRRPFPLDIQVLIRLVDVEEENIGLAAVLALSQNTHPAVRDLAFRLVGTKVKLRREAVELLLRNFKDGDHSLVLNWFETEEDTETRHALGRDVHEFWEEHPDKATEIPMLRALYEKTSCSFCRERTVRRLIELESLTDEMRAECAFDANDEIRDLVNPPADKPAN